MTKMRLEAFSDGVIAILITIMVLELKVPSGSDWSALAPLAPVFLTYVLSFAFVGVYWNNHHHMLHAARRINGAVLLANLHLLFWMSLIPFVTGWMGENHADPLPTAMYGVVLLLSAIAYFILQTVIMRLPANEDLRHAIGNDTKGKVSMLLYVVAIPTAFLSPWPSIVIYVGVALMWLIPDRRIESRLGE